MWTEEGVMSESLSLILYPAIVGWAPGYWSLSLRDFYNARETLGLTMDLTQLIASRENPKIYIRQNDTR